MTDGKRIEPDALHALADGQLDPARAEELRAALADRPEARCVADYRRINEGLRALYGPALDLPIPDRLLAGPRPWWQRRRWARAASMAAAGLALLVAGAAGGWYARDSVIKGRQEQLAMVRPAAVAHRVYVAEVRHPVEVTADQEHLVRWLSNRLKKPLKAPKLEAAGYRLMGGRLLPSEAGYACQFMYENQQGKRLTLYIRNDVKGSRMTAFQFGQDEAGVSVFYWIDGPMGYAISGQMPRDELMPIARAVYEQLES
ncbi:MAG: anti-sigma factor family protein [Rhodospirillales bacterium]